MGINFPASPTLNQKYPQPAVAGVPVYTWDGEKWTTVGGSIAAYAPPADAVPLMDATPGLVGTATEYAREDHVHPTDTTRTSVTDVNNIVKAYAAPFDAMAYSGMQINGGMEVSQEFGSAAQSTGAGYMLDGWAVYKNGTMLLSAAQATSGAGFPEFIRYFGIVCSAAQSSLSANNYVQILQPIEGYRIARLMWGTAKAQPITISFWSGHVRTGTYSIGIANAANNRSYTTTYTQNVSGVFEFKSITIPGDTTGAWEASTLTGINLSFMMACGTTLTAPVANTWYGASYIAAPGQVNGVAATSDVFAITGVTVLPGTQAPTAAQSPNIMRPYDQELVTCRRYYQRIESASDGGYALGGQTFQTVVSLVPLMRASPTINYINVTYNNCHGLTLAGISSSLLSSYVTCDVSSGLQINFSALADARL